MIFYRIETLIPAENSLSGIAYWTPLQDENGPGYWRSPSQIEASREFEKAHKILSEQGRSCRLVRVTEEVLLETPEE